MREPIFVQLRFFCFKIGFDFSKFTADFRLRKIALFRAITRIMFQIISLVSRIVFIKSLVRRRPSGRPSTWRKTFFIFNDSSFDESKMSAIIRIPPRVELHHRNESSRKMKHWDLKIDIFEDFGIFLSFFLSENIWLTTAGQFLPVIRFTGR